MKAEELRIGNLIGYGKYQDDTIHLWKCSAIYLNAIEGVDGNLERRIIGLPQIIPIPLTPDILEKAEFERMPLSSVMRFRDTSTLFFIQTRNKKDWFVYGYKYYPNPINYLHELQNLYYCLSGKELNINLQTSTNG